MESATSDSGGNQPVMPNYYAHLKFGDKVLEDLPAPLDRKSVV